MNGPDDRLHALYLQVPGLQPGNHLVTSPATDQYNCVAWVEQDMKRWWEPGFHWPIEDADPKASVDLPAYVALFLSLGFEISDSGGLEQGYLKIALYATDGQFHHVAKQLPTGAWSSKIGLLHDVRHETLTELEDVAMFARAKPEVFMRRAHDPADAMELEERGLLTA